MRTQPKVAALIALTLALGACGGRSNDAPAEEPGDAGPAASVDPADVSGEVTVLTNRTDIVDTVFEDYKERFNEEYPDVDVTFEAITDYEGEVRIRMNTDEYGDVLLIPASISPDQLPTFFEPLGTVEELEEKYRFVQEQQFDGTAYGVAITGNANGFAYNKRVWEEAGVTETPTTPEEFVDALTAISESTEAVPLYTNYADGWPVTQWEGYRGGVSADPGAVNDLLTVDGPWSEGEEHAIIDSLLYDVVAADLIEEDPATTNWELSKELIGTGEVATMPVGSWALVQLQGATDTPEEIGYMPFPHQVDGAFHSAIGGDFKNAVNVNSPNKAAARAWVDWFADESGYATSEGGIPPLLDGEFPDTLTEFEDLGVEYVELEPAPQDQAGQLAAIESAAEIALFQQDYRQRLIDSARGATEETKEDIFADLNERWTQAQAEVTG